MNVPSRRICASCGHSFAEHRNDLKRSQPCNAYFTKSMFGFVRCDCPTFSDRPVEVVDTGGRV